MGGEHATVEVATLDLSLPKQVAVNCGKLKDLVGLLEETFTVVDVLLDDDDPEEEACDDCWVFVCGTIYCEEPAGGGEAVSYIDSGSDM